MYLKATKRVNRVVSRLPGGKLSERNREKILSAVDRESIYKEITGYIDEGRKVVIKSAFDVDREYIEDAFKDAGKTVDLSEMFDRQADRIDSKYAINVNEYSQVVKNYLIVQNRKKYGLSPKIWASIDDFSDKILAIIETELKNNMDPVQVAKDIDQYVKGGSGGRDYIKGKWGKLHVDAPDAVKRLGKGGCDYRTQRVVRTEMYTARRDADIQSGRANPGATGMFTWNLGPTSDDVCDICHGWANSGPYTDTEIQSFQDESHPNCFCFCQPVLQDRDSFVQSLRDYVRGDETPGAAEIDAWASKYGFAE
jgi:hypothetical protein